MTARGARGALQAVLASRLGSANEARWMLDEVLAELDGADSWAGSAVGDVAAAGGAGDPQHVAAARRLSEMLARRLAGEPLQYVLGSWAFRTLELLVDERALIPRPETEQVVEVALAELSRQLADVQAPGGALRVVDLGTGSGAIGLSIAAELGGKCPQLRVVATDVDASALQLAEANRQRVGARHPHVLAQVDLRAGTWFEPLAPEWRGRVHLVVSNPPYVSEDEWPALDPEVRREPYGALVAAAGSDGTPGLAGVEAVLGSARTWLVPGGAVVVEMAPHHAAAAHDLARRAGYRHARIEPDLAGRPRAVVARR
jgi:release factor glutamine methyltransferase